MRKPNAAAPDEAFSESGNAALHCGVSLVSRIAMIAGEP
jgi:hypothetical protein